MLQVLEPKILIRSISLSDFFQQFFYPMWTKFANVSFFMCSTGGGAKMELEYGILKSVSVIAENLRIKV